MFRQRKKRNLGPVVDVRKVRSEKSAITSKCPASDHTQREFVVRIRDDRSRLVHSTATLPYERSHHRNPEAKGNQAAVIISHLDIPTSCCYGASRKSLEYPVRSRYADSVSTTLFYRIVEKKMAHDEIVLGQVHSECGRESVHARTKIYNMDKILYQNERRAHHKYTRSISTYTQRPIIEPTMSNMTTAGIAIALTPTSCA